MIANYACGASLDLGLTGRGVIEWYARTYRGLGGEE